MALGNNITIIGNLTREPEVRFTPSNQCVATFGVAVNERWQNKHTNEWEETVSFIDVVAWRELAEHVADTFNKGDRAVIVGKIAQRTWETQEGEKRSKVEVVADDVAPSLRYATAKITKIQKHPNGYEHTDSDVRAPAPSAPSAPAAQQPLVPTSAAPGPHIGSYDPNEEPF